MKYVLGIDIGTGSTKALAVDLTGKPFADCQERYLFSSPKPGYHEQDPEKIWHALVTVVKGVIEKVGGQPLAAGLSSAMHSVISIDADCNALAPMMTWADNRSFGIAKKLRDSSEGMAIYRATGTPLHAMSPLCKIAWLKANEPELFSKAYKFISIKEYIWYRLFSEFAIDHSLASGTGLFDITGLHWHPASLAFAGISEAQLSRPEPTSYSKPYLTGDVFPVGMPVNISGSDGCLANLGSMADLPGIAALTIGTSGAVRAASPRPLPNDAAMTFSYILDEKTYICGGPVNNGGIAMQWWVKNFSGSDLAQDAYAEVCMHAGEVPAGSEGLIFLPYLSGERAPIWDSETCGNFFGLKLTHTRAHFSRAVLEGICYALKDVLAAVEENSGPVSQINISGGFTRSELWVQILADITGKPLAIVRSDDASALGAALTAMKANGLMDEYPSISESTRMFLPNAENTVVYETHFEIFKDLYSDLKSTMHKTAMQAN
jgi:gluconokinase